MRPALARLALATSLAAACFGGRAQVAANTSDGAAATQASGTLASMAAPAPPDGLPGLPATPPAVLTDGRAIFQQFQDGLAEPACDADAGRRWRSQFSHAPERMVDEDEHVLPLFGYVVDELRAASLPTEFALIPFVESGYRPGARNRSGPAGLWQFIDRTARHHGVDMRAGYDGRLSPVESTRAAVTYLKTLYDTFDGDWQLTLMAYNAGENRVLQALRRAGGNTDGIEPGALPGLSAVTYNYVQKVHALACAMEDAAGRPDWQQAMQRPVPRLLPQPLPRTWSSLASWAQQQDQDLDLLASLNPALAALRRGATAPRYVLAPASTDDGTVADALGVTPTNDGVATPGAQPARAERDDAPPAAGTHTVVRGETLWSIARRHGCSPATLMRANGLTARSKIKPGMVLRLQAR